MSDNAPPELKAIQEWLNKELGEAVRALGAGERTLPDFSPEIKRQLQNPPDSGIIRLPDAFGRVVLQTPQLPEPEWVAAIPEAEREQLLADYLAAHPGPSRIVVRSPHLSPGDLDPGGMIEAALSKLAGPEWRRLYEGEWKSGEEDE